MASVISFLKNVVYFFGIFAIGGLLLFGVLQYKNNNAYSRRYADKKITTLFIGDSHVRECIDDAQIPNSINMAMHSESFYFSYFKIRNILKNNNAVKKIYLGCSYHSLSAFYDKFIYGVYSMDVSTKFFFILPETEKVKCIKYNFSDLHQFCKKTLKNGFRYLFLGKFENEFKNCSASKISMDKRLETQFYDLGKMYAFSDVNLHYLDEIVKLCSENNIELILLNTPLHPYYKSRIPAAYINKYNETINKYKLEIADYSDLLLDDSDFIPDGDHVSLKGANIVSKNIAGR